MSEETWQPLTSGLSWEQRPLVSFRRARTSLEADLGPPQARDLDSKGMGLYDAWMLRFSCGLEVLLLAFHMDAKAAQIPKDRDTWVEIQSNETDFAHIIAHLPFELDDVATWLPDRRTAQAPRWTVMRLDDDGDTFEVGAYGTRCEADRVADTFEARGPKQTYRVVERVQAAR
jgi:hypothetical protein